MKTLRNPRRKHYTLPQFTITIVDCDHVDTPERIIEETYGIEAYFPALSEMFDEPAVTTRIYASPKHRRKVFIATHDAMSQIGTVGYTRTLDVLASSTISERSTRDDHVHDEYAEIFYRHNHEK